MEVMVAYATSDLQRVVKVELEPGAKIADAIAKSGLCQQFPEIDLAKQAVGVFGVQRKLDDEVYPNQRVEIYRPLVSKPNDNRLRRLGRSNG